MSRKTTDAQENGQVTDSAVDSVQEPVSEDAPKTRRKPKENPTDKAISDIKALLTLKLQLQKQQQQVGSIKPAIEKLFTPEDISEEEAQNILAGLDQLGEYLAHKQQFREAKERAKAALALFEEAEMPPEAAFDLN